MGLFRWWSFSQWGLVLRLLTHATLRPIAAAAVSLLFSFGHCAASQRTPAPLPAPPASRQVTDETGRTIRVPLSIHRIVSLAPNLTETIYALGLQDQLVGDTDYCDFPPEAQQKPKVGGAKNPSLEAIVALHPDLVLVTKNLNRLETVQALEEIGIPSYATDPPNVNAIISSTKRLADLLGASPSGELIADNLRRTLANLQHRVTSLPPRRVLFIIWIEPLISIGKDTFIADALRYAGAVSVVDSSQNWPQVNLEEVVRLQPEFLVFVESHLGASPHNADTLPDLPGWRLLNAVRNHRYVTISDAINRPAPRLVSALEDLARQLHPEVFSEKQLSGSWQPALAPASPPTAKSLLWLDGACANVKEPTCAD